MPEYPDPTKPIRYDEPPIRKRRSKVELPTQDESMYDAPSPPERFLTKQAAKNSEGIVPDASSAEHEALHPEGIIPDELSAEDTEGVLEVADGIVVIGESDPEAAIEKIEELPDADIEALDDKVTKQIQYLADTPLLREQDEQMQRDALPWLKRQVIAVLGMAKKATDMFDRSEKGILSKEQERLRRQARVLHDLAERLMDNSDDVETRNATRKEALSDIIGKTIELANGKTYEVTNMLGRGGFGVALEAINHDGEVVVLKISKPFDRRKMFLSEDADAVDGAAATITRSTISEVANLHKLSKHVKDSSIENPGPKLLDAQFIPHPDNPHQRVSVIAMERIPGVSLGGFFAADSVSMPEKVAALQQTTQALDVLHGLQIVHGDVKPNNIIVDRTQDGMVSAKIIDYGSAQDIERKKQQSDAGSEAVYAIPPLMMTSPVYANILESSSKKHDVFSLGKVIERVVVGKNRFDADESENAFEDLDETFKDLYALAKEMSHLDATKRPTLEEVQRRLSEIKEVALVREQIEQPN